MAARLTEKEALELGILSPEDIKPAPAKQTARRYREPLPYQPTSAFTVTIAVIFGWIIGFYMGVLF